jgi:hypothetical protein
MHDCALSDRELTDLVATRAVRRNLDVNFDGYPDPVTEGLRADDERGMGSMMT